MPRRPVPADRGLCRGGVAGARRLRGGRAGGAGLLRPARLQLGRPPRCDGDRPRRDRRVRALRCDGGAVGLLRRHDQAPLPVALRRRRGLGAAGTAPRRAHLRAGVVPHRSVRCRKGGRASPRAGHLPRFLFEPARARGPGTAAAPARQRRRAGACRAFGTGCLLRVRGHVLRQVSRHLGPHGGGQGQGHRRHRRGHGARRRFGLPAQHRGPLVARGLGRARARHVAEVLAGMDDRPAIGEPARGR